MCFLYELNHGRDFGPEVEEKLTRLGRETKRGLEFFCHQCGTGESIKSQLVNQLQINVIHCFSVH